MKEALLSSSAESSETVADLRANRVSSLADAKVVFLMNTLSLGGAERQALNLARRLKDEYGAQPELWGFFPGNQVGELCDEAGIPWRVVPMRYQRNRLAWAVSILCLARELRRARTDVILGYTLLPNVVGGLVWQLAGARGFVWGQRNLGGESNWFPKLRPLSVRNTPVFVANSDAGAQYLMDEFDADPQRIRVVNNGVKVGRSATDRAQWRARLGLADTCLVGCMVAHLRPAKDHATLLRAWRLVLDACEREAVKVKLLLAGSHGNTYEQLVALSGELRLGDSVQFLGRVEDVSGLLAAADFGVFSSLREGSPNGLLECMASGLAVAATDIPPVRAALGERGRWLLAPQGDHEALADCILTLVRRPDLRSGLGEENRAQVARFFSIDRLSREMASIISEFL